MTKTKGCELCLFVQFRQMDFDNPNCKWCFYNWSKHMATIEKGRNNDFDLLTELVFLVYPLLLNEDNRLMYIEA